MDSRTLHCKPLKQRLRWEWTTISITRRIVSIDRIYKPGCRALVLYGSFWYPVLVIQRYRPDAWAVRWWRGCQFDRDGIEPGGISIVFRGEIVHSLWLKQEERRHIVRVSWLYLMTKGELTDISSENGYIHMKFHRGRTFFPGPTRIHQQFLTRRRSTKHLHPT